MSSNTEQPKMTRASDILDDHLKTFKDEERISDRAYDLCKNAIIWAQEEAKALPTPSPQQYADAESAAKSYASHNGKGDYGLAYKAFLSGVQYASQSQSVGSEGVGMYIQRMKGLVEIIDTCLIEAPVDFVGTGGGSQCEKEEKLWYKTWQDAIKELNEILSQPTPATYTSTPLKGDDWVDVRICENYPKDIEGKGHSEDVLVWNGKIVYESNYWNLTGQWLNDETDITHWRKLPKPPSQSSPSSPKQ